MTPLFGAWLAAFGLTLAVEIPVFVAVPRWLEAKRERCAPSWRLALAGAAGTCATHPLLWFVWPHLFTSYTVYVATGELLVAAIESATFFALARPVRMSTAIAASFLANGASFTVGLAMGA